MSEAEMFHPKVETTCLSQDLFELFCGKPESSSLPPHEELHILSCGKGFSRCVLCCAGVADGLSLRGKACSCSQKLLTYCKKEEDCTDMPPRCTEIENHSCSPKPQKYWCHGYCHLISKVFPQQDFQFMFKGKVFSSYTPLTVVQITGINIST